MLFFLVLPATWFEMCDFKGSLRTLGRRKHLPDSPNSDRASDYSFFFFFFRVLFILSSIHLFLFFWFLCPSSSNSSSSSPLSSSSPSPSSSSSPSSSISSISCVSGVVLQQPPDRYALLWVSFLLYLPLLLLPEWYILENPSATPSCLLQGRQTKRCIHSMAFLADDANQS